MLTVLLPGDSFDSNATVIGPGLELETPTTLKANRAGLLGTLNNAYWLEGAKKRYIPQPPEPVLGVILARNTEGYRVNIASAQPASLDALAFEGATKRSKPNLKLGTIVYGQIIATPLYAEPEMTCVEAATQKAGGFGELEGGFLIDALELGKCRALLNPKHPLLLGLAERFPFELAVGMNGRIWVKVDSKTEDWEEKTSELVRAIRA